MHDLKDLAFWKQDVELHVDLASLLALYGNLCLALRHPLNQGSTRELMVTFTRNIGELLVQAGVISESELTQLQVFD